MVTQIDTGTAAEKRRRQWAKNLAATLDARAITPKQFHAQLVADGCTVSQAAVYQWLSGATAPNYDRQSAVAKALGVPAGVLFPIVTAA